MTTPDVVPRTDGGMVNCAPWPTSYRAETDACIALEPRLERQRILNVATFLLEAFLDNSATFALAYDAIVKKHHKDSTKNYLCEYLTVISGRFSDKDARQAIMLYVANEHDFANVHRSVWLLMTHALARLLNFNLHGDWGDPPGDATSQGKYEDRLAGQPTKGFHTTPNLYGSYAISSQDLQPPDLGVGEANVEDDSIDSRGQVDDAARARTALDLPDIGRKIARILARRSTLDQFGQHPYHRVVKRYYFDHDDHAEQYADVIGTLIYPADAEAAAELAACIGPDEFADIHRAAWLFLAHRFGCLVGIEPFGPLAAVNGKVCRIELPKAKGGPRVFEVPNRYGEFSLNLGDVDPEPKHAS